MGKPLALRACDVYVQPMVNSDESDTRDKVLTLPAHVELTNIDTIKDEIKTAVSNDEVRRLIIDMLQVKFLDSLGVGLLVYARNRCLSGDVDLLLRNSPSMVQRLLTMSALDALFNFEAGSTSAGSQSA